MFPEIGLIALIISTVFAFAQSTVPLIGAATNRPLWVSSAIVFSLAQCFFITKAYLLLTFAFIENDFSVAYVAQHSNTQLPIFYRIAAVWSAHEGSMFLWCVMLSLWTAAVELFSRHLPITLRARIISVLGMVNLSFLLFLLITSNPFLRTFPNVPIDGSDLNPLLQDIGLIIHPPLLYMGYVGFSVAFAFAIGALIEGKLDVAWARWTRPWVLAAWGFLTLGILLGSWWAYRELGWGGWWFWDPVENASLLPWLVGTALLHSLMVTDKRGLFKAWTVFLAIFAFSLSLLGAFLVRSGVLTSVHAFANDPQRGLFILWLLALVIGAAFALFGWRAAALRGHEHLNPGLTRESALLINNVILVVTTLSIMLGTLYPLFLEVFDAGVISVGAPYFNMIFVPLVVPLLFLMGLGPQYYWQYSQPSLILGRLRYAFLGSIIFAVALPLLISGRTSVTVILGLGLAFWIISATYEDIRRKWSIHLPAGVWGMVCAHVGVAVCVIGVSLSSFYTQSRDVQLNKNETVTLGGYTFGFSGISERTGPNYHAIVGAVPVWKENHQVTVLYPEKRTFNVSQMTMTRAAIHANLWRDLYVALGEPLPSGDWSLRVYVKPFVRWIWAGGLLMAIGGFLGLWDKRYRQKRV